MLTLIYLFSIAIAAVISDEISGIDNKFVFANNSSRYV